MDFIHEKVLEATVVKVIYNSNIGLVTSALLTRNMNFIPENFSEIKLKSGSFLQAFDLYRNEKITFLDEHMILSFIAYNPARQIPSQLIFPTSLPTKHTIREYVKESIDKFAPLVSVGNVNLLNSEDKRLLLKFFTEFPVEDLGGNDIDRAMQDLRFADPFSLPDTYLSAADYLQLDSNKNQKSFMKEASDKWISLVKVYAKLKLMDCKTQASKELIKSIKYPNVDFFESEEEIVSYWPMALGPMPLELKIK